MLSTFYRIKNKKNAILDAIDYQVPVTKLKRVWWRYAKRLFTKSHNATAVPIPILAIFGIKIDIDNQNTLTL